MQRLLALEYAVDSWDLVALLYDNRRPPMWSTWATSSISSIPPKARRPS
jgi:hypothetical protein